MDELGKRDPRMNFEKFAKSGARSILEMRPFEMLTTVTFLGSPISHYADV